MRTRTVLHNSDEAKKLDVNLKPLLSVTTPEGATYRYQAPFDLKTKLYDENGNQIPSSSTIYLAKRRPGQDFPIFIRAIPYAGYFDLSNADQRNQQYAPSTLHDLGDRVQEIVNPEDHSLELWIDSPVEVDLDQSATLIEIRLNETN